MGGRRRVDSDEHYILDLCDKVLGAKGYRQHRFPFLRGDGGQRLPVDAYYPDRKLVIEYMERQHTEKVPHFDKRMTVSGVPRGEQRALYDARRRTVLDDEGISFITLSCDIFAVDARKRLRRDSDRDEARLREILAAWCRDEA
jgi:hypothetical protein